MRNKTYLVLLSIILITSFVSALNYSQVNGTEIPSQVKGLVGNQKINFFLDDSFILSAEIKEGIVYANETEKEKTTLDVYVSSLTISRIESSENPTEEFLSAYKSGEIKVIKKTLLNKIKFFFAKFFI